MNRRNDRRETHFVEGLESQGEELVYSSLRHSCIRYLSTFPLFVFFETGGILHGDGGRGRRRERAGGLRSEAMEEQ